MSSSFNLSGRVALVTGGNGGIGLGMAEGLARAGARVMIAARDESKSRIALERLHAASSGPHAAIGIDVLSKQSVEQALVHTVERLGRLDILITNAGTNIRKAPEQYLWMHRRWKSRPKGEAPDS